MERFRNKVVLVTGAARGIGRASAERFCREGASVALLDADVETAERLRQALSETGVAAQAWRCDVSDEAQVAETVSAVVARFGGLDIVHANAGILLPAGITDETVERWQRTLSINVTGIFLTLRATIPRLLERGGGAIVTTGSTAGFVAEPDFVGYCTSKAAVNHLTRQVALDYAARGIRVNAVCPGWIDTTFSDPILAGMSAEEVADAVRASVPMLRMGTPEEVAGVVAFLASDDAAYVTGHCLVMDGGVTIR